MSMLVFICCDCEMRVRRPFGTVSREFVFPYTEGGRAQSRKRIACGEDYEAWYEAKKTGTSKRRIKKAVK